MTAPSNRPLPLPLQSNEMLGRVVVGRLELNIIACKMELMPGRRQLVPWTRQSCSGPFCRPFQSS